VSRLGGRSQESAGLRADWAVTWSRGVLGARARRAGFDLRSYAFRFERDVKPLDYCEVLTRLVHAAPVDRPLVTIPATVIVQPGFSCAIEALACCDTEGAGNRPTATFDKMAGEIALCPRADQRGAHIISCDGPHETLFRRVMVGAYFLRLMSLSIHFGD